MSAARREVLRVIGVTPWRVRPGSVLATRAPTLLETGVGQGSVLLVVDSQAATATPVAGDLARIVGNDVGWAWPGPAGRPLAERVDENLLAWVVLLGASLAATLVGGSESRVGSARVVVQPGQDRLGRDPAARRQAWQALVAAGLGQGGGQ